MKQSQHLLTNSLTLIALLQMNQSMAHEPRIINDATGSGMQMSLTVGHRSEPVLEDQLNNFDMFMNFDKDGDGAFTDAVDVRGGDSVDVKVMVMLLRTDDIDAKVLNYAKLTGRLRQDRDFASRYNIAYIPSVDGAYGFHIVGTVTSGEMTLEIDERYVCGGGSQNDAGRAFSCVTDAQSFPESGSKANNLYKDNENFALD